MTDSEQPAAPDAGTDVEAVLAGERCRDVHGDTYTEPWCHSCRGWATHVAAALAEAGIGSLAQARAEGAQAVFEAVDRIAGGWPHDYKNAAARAAAQQAGTVET
jgi:hypothetical protein